MGPGRIVAAARKRLRARRLRYRPIGPESGEIRALRNIEIVWAPAACLLGSKNLFFVPQEADFFGKPGRSQPDNRVPASFPADKFIQQAGYLPHINGFGDVSIHSRLHTFLHIFGESVRRHGDNRQILIRMVQSADCS